MRFCEKNNTAKFRLVPIWNNGALSFFEEVAPNKKNKKNNNKKMSRTMRSVPDPKVVWKDKNMLSAAEMIGTWPLVAAQCSG